MKNLPEDLQSGLQMLVPTLMITSMGLQNFEDTMTHEVMQKFMAQSPRPQFDLVIAESFGNEAFYALGETFNAPVIAVSTSLNHNWLNQAIGNVEPWSIIPNIQLKAKGTRMTFNDRLINVFLNSVEYLVLNLWSVPKGEALVRKYLPENKKPLREVIKNDVCLAFLNTHFTIGGPRAYVPNMIEIGGINIDRKVEKLPEDFQKFLDTAEHGVVLFSMGSMYQASNWREDQRKAFVSAFGKLKQKVIWRYNLPDAKDLPKNIMARDWLPQKEILAHPNVRVFMTHGGMLGTTEGFFHGVPMIGIPMFGDQPVNIARYVHHGFAVQLDKTNITEEAVSWALNEVLENPKYRENVKAMSAAYHDQPMTPQETVVYWSEYVMKHKCARFMRSASQGMGVVEYNNLDVWFVVFVMFSVPVLLVGLCLVKRVKKGKNAVDKKKKSKKQ